MIIERTGTRRDKTGVLLPTMSIALSKVPRPYHDRYIFLFLLLCAFFPSDGTPRVCQTRLQVEFICGCGVNTPQLLLQDARRFSACPWRGVSV